MDFTSAPYAGNSPMRPWPSLAYSAKVLRRAGGYSAGDAFETLFFYDVPSEAGFSGNTGIAPVLVLIHGLGDEADSWRRLIPLLCSSGFRVLALDLPGFGRSVAPGRISLSGHTEAVLGLIGAVCAGNPVVLVGNSLGAAVAEAAAARAPEQVRALVLIDGSIPGGPPNPGLAGLVKLLFSTKWYRAYRDDPEGAWASLYPYYSDLDAMPGEDKEFLRRRVMERVESPSQERAFFATQRSTIFGFMNAAAFSRGIRRYEGRIFLIWGEKDRIIPLSSTDAFRAIRPDAELATVPDAGHLPQQENPAETARLISAFIARIGNYGAVDPNPGRS